MAKSCCADCERAAGRRSRTDERRGPADTGEPLDEPSLSKRSTARGDGQGGAVTVRAGALEHWDATLPAFLYALKEEAFRRNVRLRLDGLPPTLRAALDLADKSDRPGQRGAAAAAGFVSRVGLGTLAELRRLSVILGFLGDVVLELLVPRRGVRQRPRASETLALFRDAGAGTLAIVSIVTLLVGAILAFAVQVSVEWIALTTVGYILMVAGAVMVVIGGVLMARKRSSVTTQRTQVDPANGEQFTRRESISSDPVDDRI